MESLNPIRLSELQANVREVLQDAFPYNIWVIAEAASVRQSPQGHTYLELVEKAAGRVAAQARATVWASQSHILAQFKEQTGQSLTSGTQLLLCVKVNFHEVYGLSLNISRIDSTYTLGEMARRKAETIAKLEAEGCLGLNARQMLTAVPQQIAVITAENAAGWGDFQSRLRSNVYGATFNLTLFAAAVQGDGAEESILQALSEIELRQHEYDCVVLIRGGGGAVDLSCFDSYGLGRAIAHFPLPVLTGIGHERDVSVVDMMAHRSLETPTAVAEYLVSKVASFAAEMDELARRIAASGERVIARQQRILQSAASYISLSATRMMHVSDLQLRGCMAQLNTAAAVCVQGNARELTEYQARCLLAPRSIIAASSLVLQGTKTRLQELADLVIERNANQLDLWAKTVVLRDPASILRQGYSITRLNGRALTSSDGIPSGSVLQTSLQHGTIISIVQMTENGDTHA